MTKIWDMVDFQFERHRGRFLHRQPLKYHGIVISETQNDVNLEVSSFQDNMSSTSEFILSINS